MDAPIRVSTLQKNQFLEPESLVDIECPCISTRHSAKHHRQVEHVEWVPEGQTDEFAVEPSRSLPCHVHLA